MHYSASEQAYYSVKLAQLMRIINKLDIDLIEFIAESGNYCYKDLIAFEVKGKRLYFSLCAEYTPKQLFIDIKDLVDMVAKSELNDESYFTNLLEQKYYLENDDHSEQVRLINYQNEKIDRLVDMLFL